MQSDVAPASLNGVFLADQIGPAGKLIEHSCPASFHPVHNFEVLQKQAEEHDHAIGLPVTRSITVCHTERSSKTGFAEKGRVLYLDPGSEGRIGLPERMN